MLTLFLLGAGRSRQVLREVGVRTRLQGLLLWILVSGAWLGPVCLAA